MAESLPWAGSEVLWADVAQELVRRGQGVSFSYRFWGEKPAPLKVVEASGIHGWYRGDPSNAKTLKRIQRWMARQRVLKQYPAFDLSHWLLSLIMRLRSNIVIFNVCDAYQMADMYKPVLCLQRQGIPYYIISQLESEFVMLFPAKRECLREVYAGACGVAFGSLSGAEIVSRQLALHLPEVEVFDNPPNTSRQALPWPEKESLRLACVGRLDVGAKGQDVLLAVLASDAWRGRPWLLTLYGIGQDEAYIRQLISHYHLDEKVVLAGYVPSTEDIWRNEQVCLQPSRKEGTPMTVVEALFAGRPCVVSDCARMPQLIQPGKTGWVVPLSLESLAVALEDVWLNRARLRSMGEEARAFIQGYWRLDYPAEMSALFERIAKRRARV